MEDVPETKLTDRAWLPRLGLAATAAYVPPTIMHMIAAPTPLLCHRLAQVVVGVADVAPLKISRGSVLG